MARLGVPAKALSERIRQLRVQLDLSAGDVEAQLARPFDVQAAHALYTDLLGPVADLLAGANPASHLIVVPDKALTGLPLGVLVTEASAPPASTAAHAQVPWLVKQYALTTLPAVSSLRALRAFAQSAPGAEPFSGFGDPLLGGGGREARKIAAASLWRGGLTDVGQIRQLPRLPETAQELRAIAHSLKAGEGEIFLGARATETQAKAADLARFRNLAFATHGAMAGELKGLAEPALVLTPPAQASEADDGLLTASEISLLKMNADWVVLSACNTAASDGTPGAEGLSGLAKAFFYAGARSLLVSHWAVDSDATVALSTRMFAETAKGTVKAEALRRSMLALMSRSDQPSFAHPAFWAPFVVVGEGNAGWAQ